MEIKISQDIRKYKAKDIGNFTIKEAGIIALAMVIAFLIYYFFKAVEVAVTLLAIILILGFLKPYGLSSIKFLKILFTGIVTPKCYINESDFVYDFEEFKELYGEDVVIPTETVIQTESAKIKKERKQDKKRIIS